jgi:hypothetical protein
MARLRLIPFAAISPAELKAGLTAGSGLPPDRMTARCSPFAASGNPASKPLHHQIGELTPGHQAHHAVDRLAVLEDHRGRNAADAEGAGDLRRLIDVDFREFRRCAEFARDLLIDRLHADARSAPCRPEANDGDALAFKHVGFEVFAGHCGNPGHIGSPVGGLQIGAGANSVDRRHVARRPGTAIEAAARRRCDGEKRVSGLVGSEANC